jgi:hypothetical protein
MYLKQRNDMKRLCVLGALFLGLNMYGSCPMSTIGAAHGQLEQAFNKKILRELQDKGKQENKSEYVAVVGQQMLGDDWKLKIEDGKDDSVFYGPILEPFFARYRMTAVIAAMKAANDQSRPEVETWVLDQYRDIFSKENSNQNTQFLTDKQIAFRQYMQHVQQNSQEKTKTSCCC